MSRLTTLQEAVNLLKGIGCPEPIMDALLVWGVMVSDDEIKLRNWGAWADGNLVNGEVIEPNRLDNIIKRW